MEKKATRLSKAAREFNVGISTIIDFLDKKGVEISPDPNTKIDPEVYEMLADEYSTDLSIKKKSDELTLKNLREQQEKEDASVTGVPAEAVIPVTEEEVFVKNTSGTLIEEVKAPEETREKAPPKKKTPEKTHGKDAAPTGEEKKKEKKDVDVKVVGKIDLDSVKKKPKTRKTAEPKEKKTKEDKEHVKEKVAKEEPLEKEVVEKAPVKEEPAEQEIFKSSIEKLSGPTVVGKIELPAKEEKKKPVASSRDAETRKKKRRRIRKDGPEGGKTKSGTALKTKETKKTGRKKRALKPEVSDEEVQQQIRETLAQLSSKGKSRGAKYRRGKRDLASQRQQEEIEKTEQEKNILKVTEFVSAQELASMMEVPVTDIISTCMSLGLLVSINQRLDAETMSIVAEEFGFQIEFVSVELQESIIEITEDKEEDLEPRPPIVTVMGHVDHGKTKLLDYIRNANVVAGEAGGITQHIGAYAVSLKNGREITFLDTPGHEAFTAMRARGAQVTDVAIVVVAADDGVKPQTVEAINHAQAASVPIVFAINKIDKPTANSEKIKEELSNMNILVEDWGGKYQSQEISAKSGINIDELLEKVLLEAELLELKANPNKKAAGSVLESSLDKGKGFVTTLLVKEGTLHTGDITLAGRYFGHAKALFNERDSKISSAGPGKPVTLLGLNGAPQPGDNFNVLPNDREAREIANKRNQLQREQELMTKKHITLDEIGRRIAIGTFQNLNVIIKGDVDGSIEALSDSMLKLSNEEIQLNIIHKAVGQISESDITLAMASNAVVIGFQVRPSLVARKLAEKEQVDIRIYSIIYDAIEEMKAAMEGMLSPEVKEEIVSTLEILEIFKITKAGTIAGCIVKEGKINRNNKVRIIREGIVVFTGELGSLKRFKEDVKEVVSGLECGLNVTNYNDIKVGDIIEAFLETEISRSL